MYHLDREKDGIKHWRCVKRGLCTGRVATEDDKIVRRKEHTHTGDAAATEAAVLTEKMKDEAVAGPIAPKVVIANVLAGASQSAVAKLPVVRHLKRNIHNARKSIDSLPPLPRHRKDITFPDCMVTTSRGDNFVLHDSGVGDERRMFIFGTRQNVDILRRSPVWLVDGTFKVVPSLFYQLYTIHGLHEGDTFPLLYALLPDKCARTYIDLFEAVKSFDERLAPEIISADFEIAVINSLRSVFPTARLQGCFFHFTQAIMRKIAESGLKKRYETDADFALRCRYLAALAFLPVEQVVDAFERLTEEDAAIFPQELEPVLDYFEDTWIGRYQRGRRNRRAPRFDLQLWNCFDAAMQNMPKTNNAVEGWHHSFEATVNTVHANVYRLFNALKKEQVLTESRYEQQLSGEPPAKSRRKYKDCALRLQNRVDLYDEETDVVEYLRGVAHNISY